MLNNSYARAYTEVYEILNHLDKDDISMIPKEEIDFIKENRDMDYDFKLDIDANLDEYEFSRKTYSIMIYLYEEYIANPNEKEGIERLLKVNQKIIEDEKRKKYNPDNIFNNNSKIVEIKREVNTDVENKETIIEENNNSLMEKSNSWIEKIKEIIVNLRDKILKR